MKMLEQLFDAFRAFLSLGCSLRNCSSKERLEHGMLQALGMDLGLELAGFTSGCPIVVGSRRVTVGRAPMGSSIASNRYV